MGTYGHHKEQMTSIIRQKAKFVSLVVTMAASQASRASYHSEELIIDIYS